MLFRFSYIARTLYTGLHYSVVLLLPAMFNSTFSGTFYYPILLRFQINRMIHLNARDLFDVVGVMRHGRNRNSERKHGSVQTVDKYLDDVL